MTPVETWRCPECHYKVSAEVIGVPEYPVYFECRQCMLDRHTTVEMRVYEDNFNYQAQDCPWCGEGVIMPKYSIENGLMCNDTFDCPGCGELRAFTGDWESVEVDPENWEHEGEMQL